MRAHFSCNCIDNREREVKECMIVSMSCINIEWENCHFSSFDDIRCSSVKGFTMCKNRIYLALITSNRVWRSITVENNCARIRVQSLNEWLFSVLSPPCLCERSDIFLVLLLLLFALLCVCSGKRDDTWEWERENKTSFHCYSLLSQIRLH